MMNTTTIPFSKSNWKSASCFSNNLLPAEVRQWLLYPDSMTVVLKHMCQTLNHKLSLKILTEQVEVLPNHTFVETLFHCRLAYSREIQLFADSTLLMYARSLLPKNVNPMMKKIFRCLGEKPLGEILFDKNEVKRSPFVITRIFPEMEEYKLATELNDYKPDFVWARQSYFWQQRPFLLLSEYFSQDLFLMMNEVYEC